MEKDMFGERLRRLREAQGFTCGEVADAVGVPEQEIRRYEANVCRPPFSVFLELLQVLQVEPEEIMGE